MGHIDKLDFRQYQKNSWWYGGKLTRKNFDEVIELIKRCNPDADKITADKKAGTIEFSGYVQAMATNEKEQSIAKLGDYLARQPNGWGDVRVFTAREFKSMFTAQSNWGQLSWYTPTEIEYQVMQALQHDSDMCYGYDWIMDYTKVDRAETKKAIDHLRELSIVTFQRGLMTEDGEVAGAGFGINDKIPQLMAELLCARYEERRIPELGKGDTVGFRGFGDAIDKQVFKVADIKGDTLQLEIIKE